MSRYDDIIHLPHHVSQKHPSMSMRSRAAQFAPFAALTGYDDAIRETARQTDRKIALDEGAKAELGEKLRFLNDRESEHPVVALVYFVADGLKEGGEYVSLTARIKRIDELNREVLLADGRSIAFDDILEMNCPEEGGIGP